MSSFDDRESAFENKFAHDAEMKFKAEARRNKLLGLWAAELMGVSDDDEALAYAKEVIKADFEEAFNKVSRRAAPIGCAPFAFLGGSLAPIAADHGD